MRVNKNSISEFIINSLANAADGFVRVEDFLEHPSLYAYSGGRIIPPQSSFAQALRRLKKQSVVKEVIVDGRLIYRLQHPAHFPQKIKINSKWDGLWRVVVFDIPEQNRVVRDLFRRNLKNWQFYQVQRSVWVSKQPVYQDLITEIKHLKIERWVKVIESQRSTLS